MLVTVVGSLQNRDEQIKAFDDARPFPRRRIWFGLPLLSTIRPHSHAARLLGGRSRLVCRRHLGATRPLQMTAPVLEMYFIPFAQVGTPLPLTAICGLGVGLFVGFGVGVASVLPLFDLLEL